MISSYTVGQLKHVIADLPDDMEVICYDRYEMTDTEPCCIYVIERTDLKRLRPSDPDEAMIEVTRNVLYFH